VTTAADPTAADPLQALCVRLTAQRLRVRIDVTTAAGEPDVRLEVCREDRPDLTVELLEPDPPSRCPGHWNAVRVQCGARQVWRGPEHGCSLDEVEQFVEALLTLGEPELAQLFTELG
jgi:hypothetical protein